MLSPSNRPSLRALTLRAVSADRSISDEHTQIDICALHQKASLDVTPLRGRSVLLRTTTQLPTVLALLDLDGVAARVVLCTPDQAHHVEAIKERAAIDHVVAANIAGPLREPVWDGERNIDTEWVLLTSGTTGVPKLVIHTLASLAGPLDDGMAVATGAVWSTFYDIRRYGGLQILLRALLGGGSMVLSSADETPTAFLKRLGSKGVTHISGTPSHWRRALMSEATGVMNPTYVRLSGEIVDQTILDQLREAYPKANLGHAFATTEAGVGFDVRDGKAGFPASYLGCPGLKAELLIENDTLHIRSTRTARGYVGGVPLNGHDGFVDTGDLVELRGNRYFFAGRREGVINVGGQKVYPEEVEAVVRQHAAVQMARAKPLKSPVLGSLVAVDVVLRDGYTISDIQDDLMTHCRHKLDKWKVPARLRAVGAIDITPAGKVARA